MERNGEGLSFLYQVYLMKIDEGDDEDEEQRRKEDEEMEKTIWCG